jgi:hypothetical protein
MAALLRHWVELAIGSAVVGNLAIIEFHFWMPQDAVFGSSTFDPFSP